MTRTRFLILALAVLVVLPGLAWAQAPGPTAFKSKILHDNVAASATSAGFNVENFTTVGFQIFGTAFPFSQPNFQATVDGVNWVALNCMGLNAATGTANPSVAGIYRCNVQGLSAVRSDLTNHPGGALRATVTVKGDTSGQIGTWTLTP